MLMHDDERTPQEWFHERATHYVEAQVLFHLNQVGVFTEMLESGPISAGLLAERLGVLPSILEVLLDYIAGVDRLLVRDHEGRFLLTEFGRAVLDRFGRSEGGGRRLNLFDVRVGAYGPVWAALEGMLKGELVYGKDVVRNGQHAAEATYKISPHLSPSVVRFASDNRIERLVEIGVPTGLLAQLADELPAVDLVGLDIKPAALEEARSRASACGVERIRFVQGDIFAPESWRREVAGTARGAFVTLHMHELAAAGLDAIEQLLRTLGQQFPGWYLFALEQDRLPDSDRAQLPSDLWLYSMSNILIHHLIENAKILPRQGWLATYRAGSARVHSVQAVGYLGYHGYVVELGGLS